MPGRRRLREVLHDASRGSPVAADKLFEASYRELRHLAHQCLVRERPDHTLQTTDLVHEAYLRLMRGSELGLKDRAHFLAVASRALPASTSM